MIQAPVTLEKLYGIRKMQSFQTQTSSKSNHRLNKVAALLHL